MVGVEEEEAAAEEEEEAAAATAVDIRVLVMGGEAEVNACVWWTRARRRERTRSGRCSRLVGSIGFLCRGGRIHAPVCGWGEGGREGRVGK